MALVRPAHTSDAGRIAELLCQLGYNAAPDLIERKLAALERSPMDAVLVVGDEITVVGVASLHVLELFHAEGWLGRITSLVVDAASRGKGVGKLRVEAADNHFVCAQCVRAEVTSGSHRREAHAFYEAQGYKADERRFLKRYDLTGHSSGATSAPTEFQR